jgi:hypothetical protein
MDRSKLVGHDRGVKADPRHLRLVPQRAEGALVRTALRELHELATPEHEQISAAPKSGRGWHPSRGARLTAVR